MSESEVIQYVEHKDINRSKWDRCVNRSSNSLIYACSFYLDQMSKQWDALILGDYQAVMPLPYRRKMGFYYLFQPFLTPVLGVFGQNVSENLVSGFIRAIPTKFKVRDISLNHFNTVAPQFTEQYERGNYILSLQPSYESIRSQYSENIIRNISKAEKTGCLLKKDIPVEEVIELCKREWPKFTRIQNGIFEDLAASFSVFHPYASNYGVYHPDGRLLASCVFLYYADRSYYWLVGNDPDARNFGASPMLIDGFIRDHAGLNCLLDFEGSDKSGIADLYRRFGARPEPYTTLFQNFLPFPLNHLKTTPVYYRSLISSS